MTTILVFIVGVWVGSVATAVIARLAYASSLRLRQDSVRMLILLVQHCWAHSSYPDCGYRQMDSDLKRIYRVCISREEDES